VVYAISYRNGMLTAGKRVFVGMDKADIKMTMAESRHDPYFTKANPIPARPK
jgi:hypothetical protein